MKKVLIVYRFLPQYRVEFYNGLKDALANRGVELQLVYGKTNQIDALRKDEVDIEWADFIPNKIYRFWNFEALWQPCLRHIGGKDLVIVEQANRLVLNYLLMVLRYFSNMKLGVWGHGRNLQLEHASARNKFKSLFLKKCDWYFAYTDLVKRFLLENRFSEERITVVQNAIDTVSLREQYQQIEDSEVQALKTELGIDGSTVGLYCGAMYPDKRVGDIVEVCKKIKQKVPGFHMIFMGEGVDSHIVKKAAASTDWIHYVGPKFGDAKVVYFKMADIQLMPSAVGLGILDSFALETPLITTVNPFHGPEIEYIEDGVNGIITEDDMEVYSNKIIDVLNKKQHVQLARGCAVSAEDYSIDKMVNNFADGIVAVLES